MSIIAGVSLAFQIRAQNVRVQGCNGPARTYNIAVEVNANGKLTYQEGGKDASSLHVCPGDDIVWTGNRDPDLLTISFSKQSNQETPGDDGQLVTSRQHRIPKHIKRQHRKNQYPYSVTLSRNAVQYVDDPLIIIGH